jgi:MFS family permease
VSGTVSTPTVGYTLAVFGAAEIIGLCHSFLALLCPRGLHSHAGSVVGGRLSDWVGRVPVVYAMLAVQASGLVLSVFAAPSRVALFYIANALMGLGTCRVVLLARGVLC